MNVQFADWIKRLNIKKCPTCEMPTSINPKTLNELLNFGEELDTALKKCKVPVSAFPEVAHAHQLFSFTLSQLIKEKSPENRS